MSCLNIKVERYILDNTNVSVENLNQNIKVSTEKLLTINANVYNEYYKPLEVSFGIVCDVPNLKYLIVSPDEPQWIPSWGLIYEVRSNVEWEIN